MSTPIFSSSLFQKITTQIDTKMQVIAGSIVKIILINPLKNKEAILKACKEAKTTVFSLSGHKILLNLANEAVYIAHACKEAKKTVFSPSAKARLKSYVPGLSRGRYLQIT